MNLLTIDASVWVNSFLPTEAGHDESAQLLEKVKSAGTLVVIPTLALVEIAGTIARVRSMPAEAIVFARSIAALSSVRTVQLDADLAEAASTIAAEHRLRGADAVYAAVASKYGCTLVSRDKEHLNRLVKIVNVWTPAAAIQSI